MLCKSYIESFNFRSAFEKRFVIEKMSSFSMFDSISKFATYNIELFERFESIIKRVNKC